MQSYRERVIPPLWGFLLMLLFAPAAMAIFLPIDLGIGAIVAAVLVIGACAGLVAASPVVTVRNGVLQAGRASIPVAQIGQIEAFDREQTREALGTGFNPGAFHSTSPWTKGSAKIEIVDPADPTPFWLVSTRRPERLKAVIEAQTRQDAQS